MDVRLRVLVGANAGQEIRVAGPKFFVGRSEECHVRPRSDLISRHHCVIVVDEGSVTIRDFDSKNGTHVNGERIKGERELQPGDKLMIGPLEFEVLIGTSIAGKKRPKVQSVKEAVVRTAETAAAATQEMDVNEWIRSGESNDAETQIIDHSTANTSEIEAAKPAAAKAAAKTSDSSVTKIAPKPAVKPPAPKPPADDPSETTVAEGSSDEDTMDSEEEKPKKPTQKMHADTGRAAADVLKNFFKRR